MTPVLYVRGLTPSTISTFKAAAAARQLTYAQYLTRLVALHTALRERADTQVTGYQLVQVELVALDLQTVHG